MVDGMASTRNLSSQQYGWELFCLAVLAVCPVLFISTSSNKGRCDDVSYFAKKKVCCRRLLLLLSTSCL